MIENFLVELVGLSVVIFAIVAQIKKFGVRGRALTISSFVAGLLLGVGYRYQAAPMTDFSGWFWAVVFGLLAGATASGAYVGLESASGKTDLKDIFTAEITGPGNIPMIEEYDHDPEPGA